MSDHGKAVFLSYASQDAEAAKRICDALRAAGVEVWFDQSELRGGDTWDQKIRRQIKECTLFLPIVSASTQARREGYFRLEWKLADDRTHLMARGTPFLVPVCIDETKDWDALVPDSFMNVQWTRLPGGETPPKFCDRVVQLLAGDTTPPMAAKPRPVPSAEPARAERKNPPWLTAVIVIGPLLVGLVLAWRVLPHGGETSAPTKTAASATPPSASATFPRDPELRRAWDLVLVSVNNTVEDFSLAEDIVKGVIARRPTDPETVIVYAWLNNAYLNRGFDFSEERYVLGRRYAERAVQLAPDEPEALAALGQFLAFRSADLPRAEQLLRRAIELNPRVPRYYRALAYNVVRFARPADALPIAERAGELFPNDALVHYELGLHYRDAGRIDEMERAFDRSLALAPIAGAMIWKAWAACWMHSDVAGMKSWIDRLPAGSGMYDRALIVRYQFACLSQQPVELAEAQRVLQAFPGTALRDFYYAGPKALLLGDLLVAQGKPELAKGQYEAALAELARDRAAAPADFNVLTARFWTLLGLGRRDEALADVRLIIGTQSPEFQPRFVRWWFDVTPACFLLGARELALQQIKRTAVNEAMRTQFRTAFRLDPRMAPFRDDPELVALLAEPKGTVTAAPATAPSPGRELANKALDLIQSIDGTREDFALAEEFCQRALKLDSTDGDIWAIYSEVHAAFAYRGWDRTPERREQTRVAAERAIRLAPTSVLARMAQAGAWSAFNINRTETEKLLRDIVREQPDNKMAIKFLAVTVLNGGNLNECLALNERAAALPGGDPLALFNNARYLWQNDRSAEAYAMLARSLAQKPGFGSALVLKTNIEIFWKGDLAAAEATLEQIPQSALLEDRANFTAGLVHYYERRADAALTTWGAFPRDSYSDFVFSGPKGLLIGLADELDHRDAAAKIEWRAALQVVEKKIAAAPNNATQHSHKAYLLACLGEKAAAEEERRTSEQLAGVKLSAGSPLSFTHALLYVRLGRVDDFFAYPPVVNVACLRIDPRFDVVRSDPRFEKLLAEYQRLQAAPTK